MAIIKFTDTSKLQTKVADSRSIVADSREPKAYDLTELLNMSGQEVESPGKVEETPENIVESQPEKPEKLVDPGAKVDKPKGKTTAAQRKAIAKYEENFKRINCRLTPEMYQRIQSTGKSANTVIVEALTAYFAEK